MVDLELVRAIIEWVDAPTQEDRQQDTYAFDLVVEKESRRCAANKVPLLGYRGLLNGHHSAFILHIDGRIDFGSEEEWPTPTESNFFNIRKKIIKDGEYVTQNYDGTEYTYKITKVINLLNEATRV